MAGTPPPLADAEARDLIRNRVDVNMVVEAAAGTGKTTCLIGRLLTLIARGALAGEGRFAAVTFTHKAAGELRERLETALDNELARAEAAASGERANLSAAREALSECHIGTIHSFCARMIREYPVESGVGPGFEELDDENDVIVRADAWREFADAMARGEHGELYSLFELFDLDLEALGQGFAKFADYPDIDLWPGGEFRLDQVDFATFFAGLHRYLADRQCLGPELDRIDAGNDQLIPLLRRVSRRVRRIGPNPAMHDILALSRECRPNPARVLSVWRGLGLDNDAAKLEHANYAHFHGETVAPFIRDCRAAVYAAVLDAYRRADAHYSRKRRELGALNFQDLLMTAARLLRRHPDIRKELAGRYAFLLVDEVQDTDPVQAEIMFLLASEDHAQADWRRCRPRPGALFMVGDPKQSIYRFRRADIAVYQEMKHLLEHWGGMALGLTVNFRSRPEIVEWVNAMFGPDAEQADADSDRAHARFPEKETPYSPAYMPLVPASTRRTDACFAGVYALETLPTSKKSGTSNLDALRDEAERIAAFIRRSVDGGLPLPDGKGGVRPAAPGDFLIITYRKSNSGLYAEALGKLDLPCLVSAGGTLANSRTLELLHGYLAAVASPDDPVALVAALRNSLFGISDVDLYRWKQAGGLFGFNQPPAKNAPSPMASAMRLMAGHADLFRRREPVEALETVIADLGLWPYSAIGDDPASGAGQLAAALELLKGERGRLPSLAHLRDRLRWHIDTHEADAPPVMARPGSAVRIMNLHKTKGLEAPVVFLTDIRTQSRLRADFAVRRDAAIALGAFSLSGGPYGATRLAEPVDWETTAAEEERFLEAEKTRLRYVAATRAGAALVVSIHPSGKGWQCGYVPGFRHGVDIERVFDAGARIEARPRKRSDGVDANLLRDMAASRARRQTAMLAPGYAITRAKPEGEWRKAATPKHLPELGPEESLALGEVLHRLLAEPGRAESMRETAASLLRDHDLPSALAGAVVELAGNVRRSAIWRRAEQAEQVFRETPFTLHWREDGRDVIQRGVIDLVFLEKDGWVVVDYKSDNVDPEADLGEAAAIHAEQLRAYANAWRTLTKQTVKEAGVYFIRAGAYVVVAVG